MTVEEIREKLKTSEYDFLRNNKHLGSNIILLGLGGSYSYGMNIEGKLGKHMAHLIRLYYMCFDILKIRKLSPTEIRNMIC